MLGFVAIVIVFFWVKCVFTPWTKPVNKSTSSDEEKTDEKRMREDNQLSYGKTPGTPPTRFFAKDGSLAKNRILSVPSFEKAFPDENDVQLAAAKKFGVEPIHDRSKAEIKQKGLVYIGSNPYFYIDKLHSSMPYLVPSAAVLLQDIGNNFFDSLQTKGLPIHKIIITSVMRSETDVNKLRNHNLNATKNSCHLYGTTFDVCYNRYKVVEAPESPKRRQVRNDTLKWILSEVLNDMRKQDRCYIKYEVHQGCFHITVK